MKNVMHTALNIADPDGFYENLVRLHQGLTDEESQKLNARLILLMANQIGNREVLDEILAWAAWERALAE